MIRRLFLDEGPGEARGVVTLDGRPERLLIRRAPNDPACQPGARLVARVRKVDRSLGMAFFDLGGPSDGVAPASKGLIEGQRVEVEILAPPRSGKGAVVGVIGPSEGEPRMLTKPGTLTEQLKSFASGADIVRGVQARETADAAEDAVLAVLHLLPSGGTVAIEPTRALVAVDVDVGSTSGDARKAASRANREAVTEMARLVRLKGLGGPVVIDLAGKGHDGEALKTAAEAAFAADQPDVAFGAITRFGLWPIILPRRRAPVAEFLGSANGELSVETLAFRLLRKIEEAAGPAERIDARAAPEVAFMAQSQASHLTERIGARFQILADPTLARSEPRLGPWKA